MEPADARTHFGANGSTDPSQKSTAPTPEASAIRTMVPALPGSPIPHRTSTGMPFARSSASSSEIEGVTARATAPLRSDDVREAIDRPWLNDMDSNPRRRRVVNDRHVGACFHVDRFDRYVRSQRRGDEHRSVDDVAAFLFADGAASRQCAQVLGRPPTAFLHATAARAFSTRAVNAAGSVTARSARTLRSTSMPAVCSPAMKRL